MAPLKYTNPQKSFSRQPVLFFGHPLGGMEDQILPDVSQLNLRHTYLTVFSACETGLDGIRGHEGIFGLQRATRRNLILSLRQVLDDASEAFLGHFYANWLDQKMPLGVAFEETQIWLCSQKKYENPFFWAGFVLIGEP